MSAGRVLVVHAWLRGNLGDVLQLSVLMTALRGLQPRTLDLAGFPARPADAAAPVAAAANHYLADPFAWFWMFTPRLVDRLAIRPAWTRWRRALFARYDTIVCAPGPYLADYDARSPSALADIDVARRLGLKVVLANHSVGPLSPAGLSSVGRATLRVARESSTQAYLAANGIASIASADLAFLYPYGTDAQPAPAPAVAPYRAVFLRSNNFPLHSLRMEGGALLTGSRVLAEDGPPLVLATSDVRRDGRFLARAAARLGLPSVPCARVADLVQLVAGSAGVVSDRYHPAICAAVLGKPATVLPNREPHKMQGLGDLLGGRPVAELQALARTGLDAVLTAVAGA